MRVMADLIADHGLTEEYRADAMLETRSAPFWSGYDDAPGGMDEASDTEDPEPDLRRENEELRRASLINRPSSPRYKTFEIIKPCGYS